MKLETAISEILALYPAGTRFDVLAHELMDDAVNTSWRIATNVPANEIPRHARARWEVFKANYNPRARVSDIRDNSGGDPACSAYVDCGHLPFLEIRPISWECNGITVEQIYHSGYFSALGGFNADTLEGIFSLIRESSKH